MIDTHHKVLIPFLLIPGWFSFVHQFFGFYLVRDSIRAGSHFAKSKNASRYHKIEIKYMLFTSRQLFDTLGITMCNNYFIAYCMIFLDEHFFIFIPLGIVKSTCAMRNTRSTF